MRHENHAARSGRGKPDRLIRPVEQSDFEDVMDIENACFPGELAYSRRQMRHLLFRANSITLAEECDGKLAGYIAVLFRSNSGIAGIESVAVRPEFRGRGVGARLLSAAEAVMAGRGASVSRLEVSSGNEAAIAMYGKAGYGVTETIPGYYVHEHNGTRTAYRMEKALRPA